ncbi:MAG: hypothetical protein IJX27_01690 [Clostridia bacterium]|nr:hypothetical protein [Clostridia bacterium]
MAKKRNEKMPLMLALLICFASIAAMVTALLIPKTPVAGEFTPPGFDVKAIYGTPDVPKELGYIEPYAEGMTFRAGFCGKLNISQGKADVYFTNKAENEVWLMLRITSESGEVLAETGILRPGEYVKTVSFDKLPKNGEKVIYRVMAYEPQTYYSMGYFKLSTVANVNE